MDVDAKLEAVLVSLKGPLSKWAQVTALAEARQLYDQRPGVIKHGGDRSEQVAKVATCSFVREVYTRTGIPERTVRRRLLAAERVNLLDPAAREKVPGSWMANDLKLVLRVAAIEEPALQQALIKTFIEGAGRKAGIAELKKLEPPALERVDNAMSASVPENDTDALGPLLAALGRSDPGEALNVVEALKARAETLEAEIEQIGDLGTLVPALALLVKLAGRAFVEEKVLNRLLRQLAFHDQDAA